VIEENDETDYLNEEREAEEITMKEKRGKARLCEIM
jgi:hypothetical protein